ncbi:sister chromatid cohesion protein DCC1 [Coccinella septempunctata]|uniref:sister chromatid cohesion protein DCC1 n=1 Tax=Coccinella septempunctata TaxID=41139 RepID=UPI001D08E59A|nr:sister chromatid cohesion protein DCC1 [Coccinella septempunctata]
MISENIEFEKRNFEQIDEVIELAKLKQDELMPVVQTLYFNDSNLQCENLKLIQLDDNLLKDIEEGETLVFKGEKHENVVLCSKTKTYDICETETSNSLLLLSGMKFSETCKNFNERTISKATVHGIFYDYLEAVPGKPYLSKLEQLLNEYKYKGPEHEYEVDQSKLLTFEELDNIVQCSTKELQETLDKMDIIVIDNKIRMLDFEYHFRVLSYMLKLIDENSWGLDEINYEITIDSLKDIIPEDVVRSIFDKYTEESKVEGGEVFYSYKERDICVLFAKVLLSQAEKFNLEEFFQAWRESLPEGMYADEEMLYGIAIIDRRTSPNCVWAFPENSLPENINERFKVLFETKEKWTVPEITPYIKKLTTEKLDVNALLAKYARASTHDGIKYYGAKHSK